ncbi:hypothetical protein FQN54_004071 [Arachnomyces sp. PD_36]|nr:hypothetical protein FQN54_004071 [Arachnomyces sp. PD_36]
MALSRLPFGLLASTLLALLPAVDAGSAALKNVQPAAATVSSDSKAGAPLFKSETVQLTQDVIQRIKETDALADYAHLFTFDDGQAKAVPTFTDGGKSCKLLPGDDEWPVEEIWDAFDVLLGGTLTPIIPVASPCYKDSEYDNYDALKCATVVANWTTSELHTTDPGSTMFPIYEGRTCVPTTDPSGSCTQGGYSSYAVEVANVAQIQLALNFARETNVRLVVRNTGHDYNGRSTGAGALSVWMGNLKEIQYIDEYMSSDYDGPAMKVGAGVQVFELYEEADKHNVNALGGICPSVGYTGGYLAGGGHSPLMPLYGMAADQILALEVVTADGQFVTASPTENSDLFWAMGGGGGGTYGIVTSAIVKVHKPVPIVTSMVSFASSDAETYWAAVKAFWDNFPDWNEAHTYSYFWVFNKSGEYTFDITPFYAPNHTLSTFKEVIKPWFDVLDKLGIDYTAETVEHETFKSSYDSTFGLQDYRVGAYSSVPGNRLIPKSNWDTEEKRAYTFGVVRDIVDKYGGIGGYHQSPRNPEKIQNAVNPAFRKEASFLIGSSKVSETATVEELKAASLRLETEILGPLRDVSPDGGSYNNEADVMEPNWQHSFWGDLYSDLLKVKEKWDPNGVFYVHHGVGTEGWTVNDGQQGVQTQNGRLCRV